MDQKEVQPLHKKIQELFSEFQARGEGWGGGEGDSNIKKWGCSSDFGLAYGVEEKSLIFLAFKVSLRVAREEMQQFF